MPIDFTFDNDNEEDNFTINEEVLESLKISLTHVLLNSIKDQVLNIVIPSLSPKNFEGEALTYIQLKKLPATKENIILYSDIIYTAFIDNVNSFIQYDEASQSILLSPYINAFEYGDLYRPVLKTITKAIENTFPE